MWRPEGWEQGRGIVPSSKILVYYIGEKPSKYRYLTEEEKSLFELGADAMLEALKGEGLYVDNTGLYPYGMVLAKTLKRGEKGRLVFIPDKEDSNVGH